MHLRNRDAIIALVGRGRGKLMTASELARRAGCHPSTIDHLRHGRMDRVNLELALSIEEVLGVPGVLFEAAHDEEIAGVAA